MFFHEKKERKKERKSFQLRAFYFITLSLIHRTLQCGNLAQVLCKRLGKDEFVYNELSNRSKEPPLYRPRNVSIALNTMLDL